MYCLTFSMKDKLQYASAFISVLAGIAMCFLSYIIDHTIGSPELTFCAQCLLYAASIFGVSMFLIDNLKRHESNK